MKKQFFTTATAVLAALSLSVSAFAAGNVAEAPGLSDPGLSDSDNEKIDFSNVKGLEDFDFDDPGFSYCKPVTMPAKGEVELLAESNGVVIKVSVSNSDFKEDVAGKNVTILNITDFENTADATDKLIEMLKKTVAAVDEIPADEADVLAVMNIAFAAVDPTTKEVTVLTVVNPVKVILNAIKDGDKDCNIVLDPAKAADSNVEAYREVTKEDRDGKFISFTATHFSPYYAVNVSGEILGEIQELLHPTGSSSQEPTTNPGGGGGGVFDPTSPDNTTANAGDTTAAPSNTTGSGSTNTPSEGTQGTQGGNTTNAPGDNTPDDNGNSGNSGVGNDNAGAGSDKNQATGVVLAVVPAAVAAAAVLISKKRK